MKNLIMTETDEHAGALTRNYAMLGVLFWFLSALIAGWLGFFSQSGEPPIRLGLFILAPMIVSAVIYWTNAQFREFANSLSLPLITAAHLWRFVGIGFVIAYFLGKLPPQFGFPEGAGDIVAAAFALPLARALYQGRPVRKLFIAWNLFGLVDLISAITVGVLYSQGSFGLLRTGVSTALMTTFPVSLIPTFFVPLFILLHVLSLARLKEVSDLDEKPVEAELDWFPAEIEKSLCKRTK